MNITYINNNYYGVSRGGSRIWETNVCGLGQRKRGKVLCVPHIYIGSSEARVLSQKMEEMRRDVFRNIERRPPKYRFDLWDFGGQQIYYTLHQTFLNERAIYVLTVDMSKPS